LQRKEGILKCLHIPSECNQRLLDEAAKDTRQEQQAVANGCP
jgi:hypothetical protein